MCSIAGIFPHYEDTPPVEDFLRIRGHMELRGLDGAGFPTSDRQQVRSSTT